ncbi:MAG: cytochrome c biogenesis protein CcdA [bacterium]|nr:cytochrome c biogenesis protein CcdA [Acidimicrobiia bacterium]MCY4650627.1 cytochrome c biogenesis protein CcdA [bacterium]
MDFLDMALALQLAVAFGGGLLAFISPCVLPLLPGYLAMVSGYSVADLQTGAASTSKMLRATLLFVAGFTIIFVAQGAGATSISRFLLQNQLVVTRIAGAVIAIFGVVMVGMSFSNRGIFAFFARERRFHVVNARFGFLSPVVLGAAFGFGWSPCIGTILGGVLAIAASQNTVLAGMFLLFVFSLGIGVPFVLSGIGLSKAFSALAVVRKISRPLIIVAGVLMTAFGVLMMFNGLSWLSRVISNLFAALPLLSNLTEI